jgi:hypothetical protein
MKRFGLVLVAAGLTLAGCSQIDGAVKGFQNAPGGGWHLAGQGQMAMASDVEYLGASADGLIIVRMSDGSTQIWGNGRR